jgi:hypothetical protein
MEFCVALIEHPAACQELFSRHSALAKQLVDGMLGALYLQAVEGCSVALEWLVLAGRHLGEEFYKVGCAEAGP